jgi:hypothetical protein
MDCPFRLLAVSWIMEEDERVPDRLVVPFGLSRFNHSGIGQQGPISPASRRVRSNPKQAACQPRWLAKLERKYHARDHYPAVSGLQEPELFDDEEQEDNHWPVGVLKVLQHVPQAYGA